LGEIALSADEAFVAWQSGIDLAYSGMIGLRVPGIVDRGLEDIYQNDRPMVVVTAERDVTVVLNDYLIERLAGIMSPSPAACEPP
jgi:hypothetical protein